MDLLEAAAVRAWARAARTALEAAADRIDAVNVVPGRGLGHGHQRAAHGHRGRRGASALGPAADAQRRRTSRGPFARGALLAARGNSGVIVSQYLTGLRARAARPPRAPATSRTRLAVAARAAREATVGAAGGHGPHARRRGGPRRGDRGRRGRGPADDARRRPSRTRTRALGRISAEHPVLRAAHVLDAGACALLVVLDALARAVGDERPVHGPARLAARRRPRTTQWPTDPAGGAYEVMLLVARRTATLGRRHRRGAPAAMGALGDSVAVVGGDGWWHVHVHTDDPAAAIAAAGGRSPRAGPRPAARRRARGRLGARRPTARAVGRRRLHRRRRSSPAWYAATGAVTVVRCPEAPVRPDHLERAVTDTGAARVVLPAGAPARTTGSTLPRAARASSRCSTPATSSGRGRVAGARRRGADGRRAARRRTRPWPGSTCAPSRPRHARGPCATRPTRSCGLAARPGGEPDRAACGTRRTATLVDALAAHLAAHHPGVEPTVVGPTGHGPALVIGLD